MGGGEWESVAEVDHQCCARLNAGARCVVLDSSQTRTRACCVRAHVLRATMVCAERRAFCGARGPSIVGACFGAWSMVALGKEGRRCERSFERRVCVCEREAAGRWLCESSRCL